MKHITIGIIGVGNIGSTLAYTLMLKNIGAEIILLDRDITKCGGQVLDLDDARGFSSTSQVRAVSYQEMRQADVILIAAGRPQKKGEPRTALFDDNKKIITDIFAQLQPINEDAVIIMITNPVDLMTMIALQAAKLPAKQVFGSSVWLDTQRLRGLVAQRLDLAPESVDVFVIGEHGEDQIAAWSIATIGGVSLYDHVSKDELEKLAERTKNRVYEIIETKCATYYGPACAIADLCQSIVYNEKRVIPVSTYIPEYGVCLGVPVVLGERGVERRLDIVLSDDEQKKFMASIKKLQSYEL